MKKLLPLAGLTAALSLAFFAATPSAFAKSSRLNPNDVRNFQQRNLSSNTIVAEYVSPSDDDEWSGNWLDLYPIAPGGSATLEFPANYYSSACQFDIQLKFDDGQTVTNWGVNLCRGNVVLTARDN